MVKYQFFSPWDVVKFNNIEIFFAAISKTPF